ncbi:unnamed protein product [marine sediment metagenome]|uniref:Transposase DDE domain-containing protein n=1 Tax=marine sediment metagenome TaxID=412755 RepID=X0SRM5_9ZZZZ
MTIVAAYNEVTIVPMNTGTNQPQAAQIWRIQWVRHARRRYIQHLLTRPIGRPPKKPVVRYHDFMCRAGSWDRERRVVAKVEWHQGELFPRIGFIVTNLPWRCKRVVRFYNQRGTAEQWIKEGKNAVKWTKLSCYDFVDNQVRLQLFALAYNLGNFLRRLALPRPMKHWTMTTLREKLIKIGAKIVAHSRYVFFQMAEVAVPSRRAGIRCHPGSHPAAACRAQHGTFVMTRRVAQIGPFVIIQGVPYA